MSYSSSTGLQERPAIRWPEEDGIKNVPSNQQPSLKDGVQIKSNGLYFVICLGVCLAIALVIGFGNYFLQEAIRTSALTKIENGTFSNSWEAYRIATDARSQMDTVQALTNGLVLILSLGVAIWAATDASGRKSSYGREYASISPVFAFIGCLIIWSLFLPVYLYVRRRDIARLQATFYPA
jgi:hypothetical protein